MFREEENKGQDGAVWKTNNLSEVPTGATRVPSGEENQAKGSCN